MGSLLELDQIQGIVLHGRPMPYFGAYLIFRVEDALLARNLIGRLIPHVTSAADWENPRENAWINVAFSYSGLCRLGVDETILREFPAEFRQGMAARSGFLGDVGECDPSLWDLPHGGTGFHVGLMVMAGSEEARDAKVETGRLALAATPGLTLIARQDVGVPPTLRTAPLAAR